LLKINNASCPTSLPAGRLRTLLAVVLMVLAAVALAAWLWLLACRGFYWRTDQRLPAVGGLPARWPSVAVVIPARDEAAVLPDSLPTVLAQEYGGAARVILVDDGSGDGTGELAKRLGERGRLPLEVRDAGEKPAGWTGKLWALRQGIAAAGDAEYLLLTDADIAHRPGSLAALCAAAQAHRLDVVSQMAKLRAVSVAERLVVPAFVYFFALLYPFRWVNRPGARTAAAAGGCTLVRREALERAGGIAAIRGAVIDDVALARAVKRSGSRVASGGPDSLHASRPGLGTSAGEAVRGVGTPTGGRIWLGLADRVDSVRPYPTLGTLWRMVSRSAYAQLRHSPLLLAGTVAGLAALFVVPVAAVVSARWPAVVLGAAAWLIMAATYLPMLRHYRQPAPAALLLPATALLYAAMTVDSAIQHHRGRGAAWKGRTYR
jgi:hopene-associated glycosyltransferase HpnB